MERWLGHSYVRQNAGVAAGAVAAFARTPSALRMHMRLRSARTLASATMAAAAFATGTPHVHVSSTCDAGPSEATVLRQTLGCAQDDSGARNTIGSACGSRSHVGARQGGPARSYHPPARHSPSHASERTGATLTRRSWSNRRNTLHHGGLRRSVKLNSNLKTALCQSLC